MQTIIARKFLPQPPTAVNCKDVISTLEFPVVGLAVQQYEHATWWSKDGICLTLWSSAHSDILIFLYCGHVLPLLSNHIAQVFYTLNSSISDYSHNRHLSRTNWHHVADNFAYRYGFEGTAGAIAIKPQSHSHVRCYEFAEIEYQNNSSLSLSRKDSSIIALVRGLLALKAPFPHNVYIILYMSDLVVCHRNGQTGPGRPISRVVNQSFDSKSNVYSVCSTRVGVIVWHDCVYQVQGPSESIHC